MRSLLLKRSVGLWPCMVAPTKIIAGLGMSLGIDILKAPRATGDSRKLLPSKATTIASAFSLLSCSQMSMYGGDGHEPGRSDGYDFGFLHIKILKVLGLEAADKAICQLAKLVWQANYQYFLCVTGDRSTYVEYGDHNFEPVPFLRDFVSAIGGEPSLLVTSLDPFPLPTVVESGEDVTEKQEDGRRRQPPHPFGGDSVTELNEIAAARGCLYCCNGFAKMEVITKFLKLDVMRFMESEQIDFS